MKTLIIPELPQAESISTIDLKTALIDHGAQAVIDHQQWNAYRTSPEEVSVTCSLAYCSSLLFLYFQVLEPEIRAVNRYPHDPVFQDSCVECFVSLHDSNEYLNCEFNPRGASLVGIGSGRESRIPLPSDELTSLCLSASYLEDQGAENQWDLLVELPLVLWGAAGKHNSLSGLTLEGNLFKCGDMLKNPHYITWNPVETEHPDFHRPEWFGKFKFAGAE